MRSMRSVSKRKFVFFSCMGSVLVVAVAVLGFELGRYESGYSLLDERRQIEAFEALIAERDGTIDELRRQQAILETSIEIDRETYATVEENLAELEQRIQAQEEELVFFRGIVSPGDGVAGLRIQSVEVASQDQERQHLLRLLLVQSIVHNDRVTGSVRLRIAGELDAEPVVYEFAELVADGQSSELPYGFRYFQSIEQEFSLPTGFEPEQLEIEIWPREPRGETFMQSFLWSTVSG